MLNGSVDGASRAITSRAPSGPTATTSPLPQSQSQARPSRQRVDSGNPRPSITKCMSSIAS
jgi:hypothetical protein